MFRRTLEQLRKGEGGKGWFGPRNRSADPDKLDKDDLRAATRKLCGLTLSAGEADAMMQLLDTDGNGFVSIEEFSAFLQSQADDILGGGGGGGEGGSDGV